MATTTQPATGETTKQLINYRTNAGVAVIELTILRRTPTPTK